METFSTSKTQSWLSWFLRGLLILGFLVLVGRVIELQLIKGSYFRGLAEGNRIRRIDIVAPRGMIFARGGELIVGNREQKKRVVFDRKSGYKKTSDIAGARAEEITPEWYRDYVYPEIFAHITGYLGEVNEEELGKIKAQCQEKGIRKIGSLVGRSGIEQHYDCELLGIDGERLVEVDASGEIIRVLGSKEPILGSDIKTHIDLELQEKVSELMQDKKGAVVVSDVNGEILSLYSSPSFDAEVFVEEDSDYEIVSTLENKNYPLFNRAIGGNFHPGSVFKPLVAIAALEEGEIDEDFIYNDTGQISVESPYGTFSYTNWYFTQYGGTEGNIDLARAIARSTDTFFYKVGEMLGVEKLTEWSNTFGVDEKTGIDLPGEISGFVPTPSWKIEAKGEQWFLGNTYHMAIGQGDIALTPLGVNRAISAIASGGRLCTPHLVGEGSCKDLKISTDSVDYVKRGMMDACRGDGTGYAFFNFRDKYGIDVACKTGTAETTDEKDPHAWFVAFAPAEDPQIVATVLVENGGEGSKVAGPIAREIFDYWFSDKGKD